MPLPVVLPVEVQLRDVFKRRNKEQETRNKKQGKRNMFKMN